MTRTTTYTMDCHGERFQVPIGNKHWIVRCSKCGRSIENLVMSRPAPSWRVKK